MIEDRNKVYQALVSMVIERALLDIGKPTYNKVLEILNREYHCFLPDCYEHPEYLDGALKQLYGKAGEVIVASITKQLEEFDYHKPIEKFLKVICN